MPLVSALEGREVVSPKGKLLGRVTHPLFHPKEPRLVGYEVEPVRLFWVLRRKPRYLPFAAVTLEAGQALWHEKRLPLMQSQRKDDLDWEQTVIWRGMPVITEDGVERGRVRDVMVGKSTGKVSSLKLTGGVTADVALGRAEIPGEMVIGFDGRHVLIDARAVECETEGGLALTTAKGAAAAKVVAGEAARKAGGLGMKAAIGIGKHVKRGGIGKTWRAMRDAAAEGYRGEEADERGAKRDEG